jgi:hypothetical protein
MQVYGLCGFIGSGKDAACQALVDHTGATKFSFAGILKDVVASIFSWDRAMLDGITPESRAWREQVDTYWTNSLGFEVTPRKLLQHIGTEVFRTFHKDLWIKAVERRLQLSNAKVAVFTDCRFGNEMEFIQGIGGSILWVYRPNTTPLPKELQLQVDTYDRLTKRAAYELKSGGLHASETSFLTEGADRINMVVVNSGTLNDLTSCVTHAHDVNTSKQTIVPVNTPKMTAYVDQFLGNFRWQWRNEADALQSVLLTCLNINIP